VKNFDNEESAATKQDSASSRIIPRQVNGSINSDDKKLPQNDTQFTTVDEAEWMVAWLSREERRGARQNLIYNIWESRDEQDEGHLDSPRSLFVFPQLGTMHGHNAILTRVNTTAGIPSTIIWKPDISFATQMVHRNGSVFSSSCMFAHPLRFLYVIRRCIAVIRHDIYWIEP
jgi:hypothetical protein